MHSGNCTREIRLEARKKGISVERVSMDGTVAVYKFSKDSLKYPELFSIEFYLDLAAYDKSYLPLLIEKAYYQIGKTEKHFNSQFKAFTRKGYVLNNV